MFVVVVVVASLVVAEQEQQQHYYWQLLVQYLQQMVPNFESGLTIIKKKNNFAIT